MTFLQSKQSVKMLGEQLNEFSVPKDIKWVKMLSEAFH